MASSSHTGQKNGKGRQKVKMVKMENKSNLQVTFSKRRYGLFKKASELCTLTGSEIGVIVYSPGRKVFSFGHPSVHKIVNKCFPPHVPSYDVKEGVLGGARGVTVQGRGCDERMVDAHRTASVAELNMRLSVLELEMEAEKGRVAALEERERAELGWHAPMDKMGAGQLEELGASLHALKERVAMMGRLAGVGQDLQGFKPVGEMGNPAGFINPMGVPGYGYGYGFY